MKLSRRILIAAFSLLVMYTAAGPTVQAADAPTLNRIVKDGVLRVGMSGEQAPLNMRDASGKLVGLEVDLAELLAAAFDVDLRIIERPFARLLPALEAGEVDVVISGMSITPARTAKVTFVGPYLMSGKSLLTKSSLLARAVDASDLDDDGYKFVVLANSTSETFVEKYLPGAEIVKVKNYEDGVNAVKAEKVDGMIADMPACIVAVLRNPAGDLLTLGEPLTLEPIGMAIPANDPQFHNLLRNYLDGMQDMGLVELLRAKWFDDGAWLEDMP